MLKFYILMPFIFALFISIITFIKNPNYLRRTAKVFQSICLIYTCFIVFGVQNQSFSFLNINFIFDSCSIFLIFISNFVFFIFTILSKTFITKLHRLFYASSLMLLGLINLAIISNNIFLFLTSFLWIYLTNYFLSISFCEKETKSKIDFQLCNNLLWFFIGTVFLLKSFMKYFIINEINFSFINILQNLPKIDDSSAFLAFLGFIILISLAFNLFPFNGKNSILSKEINPFIFFTNYLATTIVGTYLFIKTFICFDYLFYQYQEYFAIYLIINFIFFALMSFRQNNIFKFLTNIFNSNNIILLFVIFSFSQTSFKSFIYYFIISIISYCFCATVFLLLSKYFNSNSLEEFKRINDNTKICQFFTIISLLNIASIPFLGLFNAKLICFMEIFSTDYNETILDFTPYILLIGMFLINISIYNMLYKILIKPSIKSDEIVVHKNHQLIVLILVSVSLIIVSVYPNYIFNQIESIIHIGNF